MHHRTDPLGRCRSAEPNRYSLRQVDLGCPTLNQGRSGGELKFLEDRRYRRPRWLRPSSGSGPTVLLVKPVMQSPRRYPVLSRKLLQSHFAGAVAGNECGDHFGSLTRGLVTIILHPPILPAHTHLHRLHPLYPLQMIAERFPGELGFRLPPKRRPWMSQDSRMDIFDAVALVLAYYRSSR